MSTAALSQLASLNEERLSFEGRIQAMEAVVAGSNPKACAGDFIDLLPHIGPFITALKRPILMSQLPWTAEDSVATRWIYDVCHRLAVVGRETGAAIALSDPSGRMLAAHTLFYMGEALKCEIAIGVQKPHDYAGLHAIMKWAISHRCECARIALALDGAVAACTIEGLYFRALLLADFAGGNLSCQQIEILDAWIVMWMPMIRSARICPPGAPRRADLDSEAGLRRGPRTDGGPSLYLPQPPIEKAYRAIVQALHEGQVLPEKGLASEFPVEEHVAVLEVIREALARSRGDYAPRHDRRPASVIVEAHVGIEEIANSALSTPDRRQFGARRPTDIIFEHKRRLLHLVDVSELGLGFEEAETPRGEITLGDIIAVRLGPASPVVALGKVVRRIPVTEQGGFSLGVRILSKAPQRVVVAPGTATKNAAAPVLIYVPGEDDSGRHDGFLVSERDFAQAGPISVCVGASIVTLRFNRVRDRGRGWILAGFEILDARAAGSRSAEADPGLTACAARH
ncbi:MAG TPA: hypothetical protein VKR38_16995 [Usitatibacter sp.]|nr:hypothetical protein [Usitatibacter sp.]